MAMMETASKKLRKKATDVICLDNPSIITVSPCKKKKFSYSTTISESFGSVLDELKGKVDINEENHYIPLMVK